MLSKNSVNEMYGVHSLVYRAFHGGIPEGKYIDHVDRNKSNNVSINLRALTPSQNSMNQGSRRGSTSKYKGVYLRKYYWKWRVNSHEPDGSVVHIGYFELEEDAALAYNKYIIGVRGEPAVLNDLADHDWEADREAAELRHNNHKSKLMSREPTQDQRN